MRLVPAFRILDAPVRSMLTIYVSVPVFSEPDKTQLTVRHQVQLVQIDHVWTYLRLDY
jgi:hypothetical protein